MNRREFLRFLGGAAAAVAVAPKALASVLDVDRAYPVYWTHPSPFGTDTPPATSVDPGFIVLDYTMTIQEAIDALPKNGGTVYIPSGTYIIDQGAAIPYGVSLVAEGSVTFSGCAFDAEARAFGDSPVTLLLEEDDQVVIVNSSFNCDEVRSMQAWFEVPIGDHLANLKEKMRRLCLRMKRMVT